MSRSTVSRPLDLEPEPMALERSLPAPPPVPRELRRVYETDAEDLTNIAVPLDEQLVDFDAVVRESSRPLRPESGVFPTHASASLAPPDLIPPDVLASPFVSAGRRDRTLTFLRVGALAGFLAAIPAVASVAYVAGLDRGRAELAQTLALVARPEALPAMGAAPADAPTAPTLASAPTAPVPAAATVSPNSTNAVAAPAPAATPAPSLVPAPPRPSRESTGSLPRDLAPHVAVAAAVPAEPSPDAIPEPAPVAEAAGAETSPSAVAQPESGEAMSAAVTDVATPAAPAPEVGGEAPAESPPAVAVIETTPEEASAPAAETPRSFADLLPERAAPVSSLPGRPSPQDVRRALGAVAPAVRACADGSASLVSVRVRIAGTGEVVAARPEGSLAPATASCIQSAVSAARFPAFSGAELSVSYPYPM